MADVFVSYKKEDRALAQAVVARLEQAGFTAWWDDRLTPQASWDRVIEQEIAAARCVLALWTARAVESDWVRIEANYALERKKLVQAAFGACSPPLAFSMTQRVDFSAVDSFEPELWAKLLSWVALFVGPGGAARPAAQPSSPPLDATAPGPRRVRDLAIDPVSGDVTAVLDITTAEAWGAATIELAPIAAIGRDIGMKFSKPTGFIEGMRIRFAGGGKGKGDLFATLAPQPAHGWRLAGRDVWVSVRIAGVLFRDGGHFRLRLPIGRTLEMRCPPQTAQGAILRLRGEGLPAWRDDPENPAGDLLVEMRGGGPDGGIAEVVVT